MGRGIENAAYTALTRERLTPGDTPVGISDSTRIIGKTLGTPNSSDLLAGVGIMEAVADPPTGWTAAAGTTAVRDAVTFHRGASAVKITAGAAGAHCYADITTVAGRMYRLRAWYQTTAGDFAGLGVINDPAGTPVDVRLMEGYGKYQHTAGTLVLPASDSAFSMKDVYFVALGTTTRIKLIAVNIGDIVWFDSVDVYRMLNDSIYPGRFQGRHARFMRVNVYDNSATISVSGETPTQSTAAEPYKGIIVAANDHLDVDGEDAIKNFLVVDTVSSSASNIEVTCYF